MAVSSGERVLSAGGDGCATGVGNEVLRGVLAADGAVAGDQASVNEGFEYVRPLR